jgi:hypothetical protein
MPAFLRAGAFAVADVLSDRYAFTIPAYQRPYAWTAEQVEQLLDDALEAMDRARSQTDPIRAISWGASSFTSRKMIQPRRWWTVSNG